jgi:hypothetical protein
MLKTKKPRTERALQELLEPNPSIDIPERHGAGTMAGVRGGRASARRPSDDLASASSSTTTSDLRPNLGNNIPLYDDGRTDNLTPEENKSVRVFTFDGPRFQEAFRSIAPGGESIVFSTAGKPGHLVLTMRQIAWLLTMLRRRAGIATESALFISDPMSNRLIFIPGDAESIDFSPGPRSPLSLLQYRLEFELFGSIVSINVYEQPECLELPRFDPHTRSRRTPSERIAELLARPPAADYDQLSLDLAELMHTVQQEAALRLAPALKQKMQAMPHQSYSEKQDLTKWVTSELREYGLAVQWKVRKKTDDGQEEERVYPAHLHTDVGNHPKEGRFQIQYRDETGKLSKPLSTPSMSVLLEHFEVMVDDPARYRTGKWTDRAAHPHPRQAGRK